MPAPVQLKITLVDSEPEVWRQVIASADVALADLHEIIQRAMGWQNRHDYSFQLGVGAQRSLLSREALLLEVLAGSGDLPVYYNYDFENGWRHRIAAEPVTVSETELNFDRLPICIAGEAACPPEESGGIWGYDQLLVRLEDLEDPDYVELLDRYGDFDPGAFDLAAANARLRP